MLVNYNFRTMTENTAPNPSQHPISETIDLSHFELTSPFDIAHALRQLMNKREMIALYFNQGSQFALTTIVDVDAKSGFFLIDQSGSAEVNRKLAQSERNVFVATPDGIKHQFVCGPLKAASHHGKGAFRLALPQSLIKLQRREFFRLATPITNPLKCKINDHPAGKLELPLNDISLGGICLMLTTPRDDIHIMDILHDCSIDLPQFGVLPFEMEVRNIRPVRQRNDNLVHLVGCQFHNLPGTRQNMLQKYITQLQKEQLNRAQ